MGNNLHKHHEFGIELNKRRSVPIPIVLNTGMYMAKDWIIEINNDARPPYMGLRHKNGAIGIAFITNSASEWFELRLYGSEGQVYFYRVNHKTLQSQLDILTRPESPRPLVFDAARVTQLPENSEWRTFGTIVYVSSSSILIKFPEDGVVVVDKTSPAIKYIKSGGHILTIN